MDGDLVVVEVLPQHLWQCKSSAISHSTTDQGAGNEVAEGTGSNNNNRMMSGRVVGVLQRNTRDFVVALQENKSDRNRSEKVGMRYFLFSHMNFVCSHEVHEMVPILNQNRYYSYVRKIHDG